MLPSLSELSISETFGPTTFFEVYDVSMKRKLSSLTYGRDQPPTEQLALLRDIQHTKSVSYAKTLGDAFDAYAAIIIYAKSQAISGAILKLSRKRLEATQLFKEAVESSGGVWNDTIRKVIQDSLDKTDDAVWNIPLGYESAHNWMAALFLFLNSTAVPEITTELQPYMRVPTSNDERRVLIEELLKYAGDIHEDARVYLDLKLLKAIYEQRGVDFDVALKKRLASNLGRLLDDGIRMFGVSLDASTILFRADDRPEIYKITDISTALHELSKAVVSTSTRPDIDDQFCNSVEAASTPSPCVVYEFHVAVGTPVLPITAYHPFLEASLIPERFMTHSQEQEVLLPKGLTYELRSAEAKPGKTSTGRSTMVYSVNVSVQP